MRVLLVLGVALVAVSAVDAAPPPQQLFGTWTRTVSKRDVLRAGAKKIEPGSVWTLVVRADKSSLRSAAVTGWTGMIVAVNATNVNIELGTGVDLYSWRLAGHTLILAKKEDQNTDRWAVLGGTWQRDHPRKRPA